MTATAPKRLWILGGDAQGLGDNARRYQSTKAAVRGWHDRQHLGGLMILMSPTGPRDFTTEFAKLRWPDRELFARSTAGMSVTADPAQQANYDRHMTVCLADPAETQKLMAKQRGNLHTCAWVKYTAAMHAAYLKDIADNAALIENLLTNKGIT